MFDLELRNHPAVQRHPLDRSKPLIDNDGDPVPLLPDHRAIYFERRLIAYVVPSGAISFIIPASKLGRPLMDAAAELVGQEFKEVPSVNAVSDLIEGSDGDE